MIVNVIISNSLILNLFRSLMINLQSDFIHLFSMRQNGRFSDVGIEKGN